MKRIKMKIKVFDQKGKELEETIKLEKSIWDTPMNEDLVAQSLYVYNSNQRIGAAHAKSRGEVSGGGRKPWRQKGTGRARAGSIRSPLFVKGGVTFVPNNRNWKKSLNEKMKKKAISCILSEKLREKELKFIKFPKKIDLSSLRKNMLESSSKKTLLISEDENVLKSVRNVPAFIISKPSVVNIYNVLNNKEIMIDIESLNIIETRLKNGK